LLWGKILETYRTENFLTEDAFWKWKPEIVTDLLGFGFFSIVKCPNPEVHGYAVVDFIFRYLTVFSVIGFFDFLFINCVTYFLLKFIIIFIIVK